MSWYDSAWSHRWPVVVDKLSAGTAAVDVTITVPVDLEQFWSVVDNAGDDVRVAAANGTSLLVYKLTTWTYASRTAVIDIQGWVPPAANCMAVIWLYWGNAVAASAAGAFAPAGPRTGYCHGGTYRAPVYPVLPELPGSSTPRIAIAKTSAGVIQPWINLGADLTGRRVKYNAHLADEEISYLTLGVDLAGADQSTMYDQTQIRMVGGGVTRLHIQAGTNGVDYTAKVRAVTTHGRTIDPRYLLQVRNADET